MSLFSLFVTFLFSSAPFSQGESLSFDVYYGFLKLGTMRMRILKTDTLRNHRIFVIMMDARSEGAGALFTVADTIYSYIDADSFYTLRYIKKLKEGKFNDSLLIEYYPDSGFAIYSKGRKKENLLYGAVDPLGLYYYLRTLKLKSKDTLYVPYHVDRRNKNVRIVVRGIRSCKYKGDKIKCYVLEPDLKGGIIKGGGKAEIYLSADSLRLPVYMKSKLYFGSLKVRLKSYRAPVSFSNSECPEILSGDTINSLKDTGGSKNSSGK